MDRYLKERLVGAAVLVAAAIILIPEMLSGPHDAPVAPELAAENTDASGVKTYTIDLKSPQPAAQRSPAPAQVETTSAPPPETLAPAEAPAEKKEESVRAAPESSVAQETQDRNARELEEFAAEKRAGEKNSEKTSTEKSSAPVAVNAAKPGGDKRASGAWAVQVASFGVRATSERIAADLQSKGYSAFVTASEVKGQTMYRVRVGPTPDRAAAETLLKKIKPLHSGAAVVPQ